MGKLVLTPELFTHFSAVLREAAGLQFGGAKLRQEADEADGSDHEHAREKNHDGRAQPFAAPWCSGTPVRWFVVGSHGHVDAGWSRFDAIQVCLKNAEI